ncbi:MAG TPA: class III extradiol ring-cleavage dioxygenase [Thermoanaerobaculia bacterium]
MILFLAHGAPSVAIEEDGFTRAVTKFGSKLRPSAAVVISAHWQTPGGVRANAVSRPETLYDFGGFASELYRIKYEAPGHPPLANRIAAMVGGSVEKGRGWDHGVWVPLSRLFPSAETPIVELSLPFHAKPADLIEVGRRLQPLRDENILLIGSGGIVHNLGKVHLQDKATPAEPWAKEFDAWIAARLEARDLDAIAQYRELAPHAALAVPTPEHFEPLLVLLGAHRDTDQLTTIYSGFHYGTLSMRTIALQ